MLQNTRIIEQWLSEFLIKLQRNNGLGKVVEISSKKIGGVMYGVGRPIEVLAIVLIWVGDNGLELFDTASRPAYTKNALDLFGIGGLEKMGTVDNNDGNLA